nr:ATP-binding cassette domain-containing protein [Streptomyces sp. Ncost-T10-10d]
MPLPGSPAPLSTTLSGPGLVLVTGPNGSGKSTLLGQLAGRIPAPVGTVLLDGTPVHDLPARVVAETVTLVEADDWLADDTVAANLRQAAPLGRHRRLAGRTGSGRSLRAAARHPGGPRRASGPRGGGGASRSHAPCCGAPRCSCWTSPPPAWTGPPPRLCWTRCSLRMKA